MKKVIDRASSRGYFNHGWLKTHHTFSFANYYNPERIHFGALRVLNDDSVDPSIAVVEQEAVGHDQRAFVTISNHFIQRDWQ